MMRVYCTLTTRVAAIALAIVALMPAAALGQAAGQASNPSPINGATEVSTMIALSWSGPADARRFDIRFGTQNPPPVVARNLSVTTYQPGALAAATTFYWQIDTRGKGNAVTPGPVWSFTTKGAPAAPPAPSGPSPTNGAVDVATSTALTWAASAGASTYDVAFGTTNPPAAVSMNQTATSYMPPAVLGYATTYYWQVTAKGAGGTTAGAVWSFTTESPPPPVPPQTILERLRVMTWNIRMGQNLAGTMNVDAQVALMADSGAHVIALQEVVIAAGADLPFLYESKLEALTGRDWTAVWAPGPRPATATPEGNLLLTSLPVVSSSIFQHDSTPADPTWLDTKRAVAQIAVAVNGVTLNVFGTHLPLEPNHRRLHIDAMLPWVTSFPGPRLFGGDFNLVAGTTEYATLSAAFADAWTLLAPADQGFTQDKRNSAGGAPGRIDYWWQEKMDPQARGTEIWVVKTTRSDHHALVIDIHVQVQ
jgi:endonuclease/exonuclease/phosphatase family metal-dependent hydrolase